MSDIKKTELLQFPCSFPLKIIGKAGLDLQAKVLQILRHHLPQLSEAAITLSASKNNKYTAITATIDATSQAMLDAIYRDLTKEPSIIMVL